MGLQCHYSKFTSKFSGTFSSFWHRQAPWLCCPCLRPRAGPGEPEPAGRCLAGGARGPGAVQQFPAKFVPALSARGSSPAPRPGQGTSLPELPGLPRLATSLRPFLPASSPTAGVQLPQKSSSANLREGFPSLARGAALPSFARRAGERVSS